MLPTLAGPGRGLLGVCGELIGLAARDEFVVTEDLAGGLLDVTPQFLKFLV